MSVIIINLFLVFLKWSPLLWCKPVILALRKHERELQGYIQIQLKTWPAMSKPCIHFSVLKNKFKMKSGNYPRGVLNILLIENSYERLFQLFLSKSTKVVLFYLPSQISDILLLLGIVLGSLCSLFQEGEVVAVSGGTSEEEERAWHSDGSSRYQWREFYSSNCSSSAPPNLAYKVVWRVFYFRFSFWCVFIENLQVDL